jgi:CxxC motif-containing protein
MLGKKSGDALMIRQLICIGCPLGCNLTVSIEEGSIRQVTGNHCPRGADYAHSECLHPKRMVTSTVPVSNGQWETLPVKTREEVPKDKVLACVACLQGVRVQAPVRMGEVVLTNAAGTGVDFIAARHVEVK